MMNPLNALNLEDVTRQMDRLTAAYDRKKVSTETAQVWLERLREASVKPPELKRSADWVMDRKDRFPSLSVMLESIYRERSENTGADAEARRIAEAERPDDYEEWRQATKRNLGLSSDSDEKLRRYGPEIKVKNPYIPPHLRRLMTEDPDPQERGNGPRPMF